LLTRLNLRLRDAGFVRGWRDATYAIYDLALLGGVVPVNHDGEVASCECLPIERALALACGREMALDAALVTLDFALRHRLLDASQHIAVAKRFAALRSPPDVPTQ
jgi:hypothetical protein